MPNEEISKGPAEKPLDVPQQKHEESPPLPPATSSKERPSDEPTATAQLQDLIKKLPVARPATFTAQQEFLREVTKAQALIDDLVENLDDGKHEALLLCCRSVFPEISDYTAQKLIASEKIEAPQILSDWIQLSQGAVTSTLAQAIVANEDLPDIGANAALLLFERSMECTREELGKLCRVMNLHIKDDLCYAEVMRSIERCTYENYIPPSTAGLESLKLVVGDLKLAQALFGLAETILQDPAEERNIVLGATFEALSPIAHRTEVWEMMLTTLLDDDRDTPHGYPASRAAEILANVQDKELVERLCDAAASHESPLVRQRAITALAGRGDKQVRDLLSDIAEGRSTGQIPGLKQIAGMGIPLVSRAASRLAAGFSEAPPDFLQESARLALDHDRSQGSRSGGNLSYFGTEAPLRKVRTLTSTSLLSTRLPKALEAKIEQELLRKGLSVYREIGKVQAAFRRESGKAAEADRDQLEELSSEERRLKSDLGRLCQQFLEEHDEAFSGLTQHEMRIYSAIDLEQEISRTASSTRRGLEEFLPEGMADKLLGKKEIAINDQNERALTDLHSSISELLDHSEQYREILTSAKANAVWILPPEDARSLAEAIAKVSQEFDSCFADFPFNDPIQRSRLVALDQNAQELSEKFEEIHERVKLLSSMCFDSRCDRIEEVRDHLHRLCERKIRSSTPELAPARMAPAKLAPEPQAEPAIEKKAPQRTVEREEDVELNLKELMQELKELRASAPLEPARSGLQRGELSEAEPA